jgi:hypothetical protein
MEKFLLIKIAWPVTSTHMYLPTMLSQKSEQLDSLSNTVTSPCTLSNLTLSHSSEGLVHGNLQCWYSCFNLSIILFSNASRDKNDSSYRTRLYRLLDYKTSSFQICTLYPALFGWKNREECDWWGMWQVWETGEMRTVFDKEAWGKETISKT